MLHKRITLCFPHVHNMVLGRTLILPDRDIMPFWTLRRHEEARLLRDVLYHIFQRDQTWVSKSFKHRL